MMNHDISYYRKIQDAYGAQNKKQAQLNSIKKQINRDFLSPVNWESVEVNGKHQELLIMKSTSVTTKKVEARPGEVLRLGALVFWSSVYWLVTTLDADNQVQFAGTMTQCNTVLRWQDEDQEIRVAYAVAEDATKYGTGVSDNSLMRIGEFSLKLKVQLNDDTLGICRDKRFLIGECTEQHMPNAYIVSRINQVTGTYLVEANADGMCDGESQNYGYIELTLLEDQYRPNVDRADLMIADYKESGDNPFEYLEGIGSYEEDVDW